MKPLPLFVGYDPREAVAYHAFCQSVLSRSSIPVAFIPLAKNTLDGFDGQRDGSNQFIFSRYLVPYLMGWKGWAVFADGDMVCKADIAELWNLRDEWKAVQVVKHDYKTKHPTKYLGQKNVDYPRKNWSSLILWNCAHYQHKFLTPEYINKADGKFLHRFAWLEDDKIGELPKSWNWLTMEYPENPEAKLLHYTVGTPCFSEYTKSDHSNDWHKEHYAMNHCEQTNP